MFRQINAHTTLLVVAIATSVAIGVFCSKKSNPASSTEEKTPTLTIVTPENDTLVDRTTDSIFITAVIGNSDAIDSVAVNGTKVSTSDMGGDTLSLHLGIAYDTTKFIITVYYQEDLSILDSILVFREGTGITGGMAKISGILLQESSSAAAKRLAKPRIAHNAQGDETEVEKVMPVLGADIMVYDAEELSTSSDTTVKTDSAGMWSVELPPGNYFVFAVYFDRTNLEIVTTMLPDIKAEEDKETATDTAIAVSDDISPMLMTFLDAAEANDANMFIGSDLPKGVPIVMSFSEPMTRASVGDSVHGIVLGRVDDESSDLALIDTVPVQKLWGPNGKELRLMPKVQLVVGTTYKVIIPSALKDLALNKLDDEYSGIFQVTEASELPDFAIKTTVPAEGDTIPAGFPLECIFTRPLDGLSLNKQFTIASEQDSAVSGFFEVKGNVARFISKKPWKPEASYTLTIKSGTKDLLGDSLGTTFTLSFKIRSMDEFEKKEGVEGMVATAIKQFMGAYIAGDIENFSKNFHAAFELIENNDEGTQTRLQLAAFLEKMRTEIERRNRLAKYGIIAPVYYYPVANDMRYIAWKLMKGSNEVYYEDVGPDGAVGRLPRVLTLDNNDVTDSVHYVNGGVVYHGDTLYFEPDRSKTFIDENTREDDPTVFGRLLKNTTNVETQEIMLNIRQDFSIRNLNAEEGNDTASVMIELVEEEQYLDGKRPYPIEDPDNPPPNVEKRVTALQTKLVYVAGKWMVLQIAATNLYSGDKEEFSQQEIADTVFQIKNIEQTRPVEFVKPPHKGVDVATPITLEWSVGESDGIGGYLIAITNMLSGGNEGLLIFTRKNSLSISETGAVDSNATILSVDPKSLTVPIPYFSARLTSFTVNDSDVYVWKVMGIRDSTASAIKSGMPLDILADSDFGTHGGYGIFTLMDEMPDISTSLTNFDVQVTQTDDRYADRDNDQFPDWIEKAFATSPDDPGSFPNFTVDTDLDGYPDFFEKFAESDPEDPDSKPEDSDPADNIPDRFQVRPEWRPELNIDNDGDGFPNEIEILFGTDPWNSDSKPAKSIKAMVPVNSYYGGIKIGDQMWKRMKFSLVSDTSGDFVYIDTTELEGIARNGVDLTVKLYWINGEWVFFLGLVNGPNTGKFIKVRFYRDGTYLRGPIDLADMENGGGPYIGEFVASTDSIEDFNNIGSGTVGPIVNPDEQGTLNLETPPMERLQRPDASSDMTLQFSFMESGDPRVKIDLNGDTVTFEQPIWKPGQFPSLECTAPQSAKKFRLEGNLHKIEGLEGSVDTLVLLGIVEFDMDNGTGGSYRENFNYTVLITNIDDPTHPEGTWTGWYAKPVEQVINVESKPFIGSKDSVDTALQRTEHKGVIMGTQEIVTIESVAMEGDIWTAKVDTTTYYIMEQTGEMQRIMFKVIEDKPYIVLTLKNGEQGVVLEKPLFTGDSLRIVEALGTSSNQVMVAAPDPFMVTIDPGTLRKETKPTTTEFVWMATVDGGTEPRNVVFLSVENDHSVLQINNGKPLVLEIIEEVTQP